MAQTLVSRRHGLFIIVRTVLYDLLRWWNLPFQKSDCPFPDRAHVVVLSGIQEAVLSNVCNCSEDTGTILFLTGDHLFTTGSLAYSGHSLSVARASSFDAERRNHHRRQPLVADHCECTS